MHSANITFPPAQSSCRCFCFSLEDVVTGQLVHGLLVLLQVLLALLVVLHAGGVSVTKEQIE